MDQVVRALKLVAESRTDTRRAAASIELAICYACDFVECGPLEDRPGLDSTALRYLIRAAELGDDWAKAITYRVASAINQPIPKSCPVKSWLFDASIRGSKVALSSLEQLDSQLHTQALRSYRSTLCGNSQAHFSSLPSISDLSLGAIINSRKDTFLHWISSTGQPQMLTEDTASQIPPDVINSQNSQGDTPLLCAARAGHHHILMRLIGLGADGKIRNFAGENALHFLGNLDEDQVFLAAQILIIAGAQVDAEAKSYTGNTYLEMRPVGKGCPKLRAVMLDQPHVLRALLQLENQELKRRRHTSASTQRLMIAWALRLRHIQVLKVLEEYFHASPIFTDIHRIRIWCSGRRCSLLELCIWGNASSRESSGFDIPDKFWRYINYGKDQWKHLESSLSFLLDRQSDNEIPTRPCRIANDGLFFAITEGNRDAAKILLSTCPLNLQVNFPSDATLEEIQSRVLRPGRDYIATVSRHVNSLSAWRSAGSEDLQFLDKVNWDAYGNESVDAYISQRAKHRLPSRTRSLRIRENENQSEWSDEDDLETALDPMVRYYLERRWDRDRSSSSDDEGNHVHPSSNDQPRGVVDAILLAIACGRRGIFVDLITGVGCSTLQTSHSHPCFVFMGKKYDAIERKLHTRSQRLDLRGAFPKFAARYLIMSHKLSKGGYFEFDGNFRCSLLYMTLIARSQHRDIYFA